MNNTTTSLHGKLLYLSGPITDPDPGQQRRNMDRFFDVASKLRQDGWTVFNPAELETAGWAWEKYLARDIIWIVRNCPKLYLLHGWKTSVGARLEVEVAQALGLGLVYEL